MSEVVYRHATEEDLPGAAEVFLVSVVEMAARTGAMGLPRPPREAVERSYRHVLRTGIFHVAETEGRVVAVCHAVVRERLRFLSAFRALPETQRQKLGGPLLRGVIEEGARAGAEKFFTWSSPDTTAMAAYLRAGMLPGYQILMFAGTPKGLGDAGAEFDLRPLRFETANELDGLVREAARRAEEVRLLVPGVNHAAIRFALRAGLRLTGFSHLLTTAPFGRMEQYLSSGPALF